MLVITPDVSIPDEEFEWKFIRSSGPGGQNVNKVSTAAQLRFDLEGSSVLTAGVKARLRALSGRRLTADGTLLIVARNQRTQEHNRRDAEARLSELIRRALIAPKPRKATKPTRAARERRLEHKTHQGRTKRLRGRPGRDD
jgi:ribosome-associated protein